MPYRRLFALFAFLALLLQLPAAGQEIPPVSARPEMPAEVRLPAGVERPDLADYAVVVIRPDVPADLTTALHKSNKDRAVAFLLAPGDHGSAVAKLARNRAGAGPDRPAYIGPLDPEAPLPIVRGDWEMFGSHDLIVQGLAITGRVKFGAIGMPGETQEDGSILYPPGPAAPRVEGCWIGGGVSSQAGKYADGSFKPVVSPTVERSWIIAAGGQGWYSDHSIGLVARECIIDFAGASGTRDHGLYFAGDVDSLVERCIITRSAASAIKLNATIRTTIRDCVLVRNHSWGTFNANPSESDPDKHGEDLLVEGCIVTSSGRRTDVAGEKTSGGRLYAGWSWNGAAFRDNLFVWDRGISAFRFQRAIYGGVHAPAGRGYLVEGNVAYGAAGHFVTVTADAQVAGLVVRGNLVAEPAEWTDLHMNPLKGVETAARAAEVGLVMEGNRWPAWVSIDPRPETAIAGGEGVAATFRDPTRTIETFARDVLYAGTILPESANWEGAFFSALSTADPGATVTALLTYFREGYEVVSVEPGVPPASIPWIEEEDGPEDPIDEEPPAEPETPEEPPAGPEDPPETEEPDEPAPPAAGEVLAVIRVPSGDEWIEIVIRRVP